MHSMHNYCETSLKSELWLSFIKAMGTLYLCQTVIKFAGPVHVCVERKKCLEKNILSTRSGSANYTHRVHFHENKN